MKRILLSLGLISAIAPGLMAETYTGPTTPMPAEAIWNPTTAAPGVYSELVGSYQCNLSSVYSRIGSGNQLLFPGSGPNGWIVNEENEIIYGGIVKAFGTGTRNYNNMIFTIPEEDKITEPGTYYIILPTGISIDEPNQYQDYATGTWIDGLYNVKAGPYIVGELSDPVDAQITLTPTGVFSQPEGVSYVTLTVDNASMFNVGDRETSITVTGPSGALAMEPGVVEGNTIRWEFPIDENGKDSQKLANGNYTIDINFSTFSGFTAQLNPITFPENSTYSFSVETGEERVVPTVTISPAPGVIQEWTTTNLGFTLKGYKFKATAAELKADPPVLIIVDPEGEVYYPEILTTRLTQTAVGYTVGTVVDFSKYGTYNVFWKIGGREGIETTTNSDVIFDDLVFAYEIPAPAAPAEPAGQTTGGADVIPNPGSVRALDGIRVSFDKNFIDDFEAWTDDFNAAAILTNLTDNSTFSAQPILGEAGTDVIYDVKLSSDEKTTYKVAICLWGQQYYTSTAARAAGTANVYDADKAWIVVEYTLDKATLVNDIDAEAKVYYLDINGNRLQEVSAKGISIKVTNGKAVKIIR